MWGEPVTSEDLVYRVFGVPLERCAWELERYDAQGCVAHVGLDERMVSVAADQTPEGWAASSGAQCRVAAVRFVVVREDQRGERIGTQLVDSAMAVAKYVGFMWAVAFTDDAQPFFEKLNFVEVRPSAGFLAPGMMVAQLADWPWPSGLEDLIGDNAW